MVAAVYEIVDAFFCDGEVVYRNCSICRCDIDGQLYPVALVARRARQINDQGIDLAAAAAEALFNLIHTVGGKCHGGIAGVAPSGAHRGHHDPEARRI